MRNEKSIVELSGMIEDNFIMLFLQYSDSGVKRPIKGENSFCP